MSAEPATVAAAALALESSQRLSKEIVEDMEQEWVPNQVSTCTAVKVLRQVASVSIFSFNWDLGPEWASNWQCHIYKIIRLLGKMKKWSRQAGAIQGEVWSKYSEKWRACPGL